MIERHLRNCPEIICIFHLSKHTPLNTLSTMKKSLFAFALVGSIFLGSCTNQEENTDIEDTEQDAAEPKEEKDISETMLVGTWQQTELTMGEEIPEEELEMLEKTIKETVENTSYIFADDGSYKVNTWMLGRTVQYAGTYSTNGETLTLSDKDEDVSFTFSISESELTLLQDDEGTVITQVFERK